MCVLPLPAAAVACQAKAGLFVHCQLTAISTAHKNSICSLSCERAPQPGGGAPHLACLRALGHEVERAALWLPGTRRHAAGMLQTACLPAIYLHGSSCYICMYDAVSFSFLCLRVLIACLLARRAVWVFVIVGFRAFAEDLLTRGQQQVLKRKCAPCAWTGNGCLAPLAVWFFAVSSDMAGRSRSLCSGLQQYNCLHSSPLELAIIGSQGGVIGWFCELALSVRPCGQCAFLRLRGTGCSPAVGHVPCASCVHLYKRVLTYRTTTGIFLWPALG